MLKNKREKKKKIISWVNLRPAKRQPIQSSNTLTLMSSSVSFSNPLNCGDRKTSFVGPQQDAIEKIEVSAIETKKALTMNFDSMLSLSSFPNPIAELQPCGWNLVLEQRHLSKRMNSFLNQVKYFTDQVRGFRQTLQLEGQCVIAMIDKTLLLNDSQITKEKKDKIRLMVCQFEIEMQRANQFRTNLVNTSLELDDKLLQMDETIKKMRSDGKNCSDFEVPAYAILQKTIQKEIKDFQFFFVSCQYAVATFVSLEAKILSNCRPVIVSNLHF